MKSLLLSAVLVLPSAARAQEAPETIVARAHLVFEKGRGHAAVLRAALKANASRFHAFMKEANGLTEAWPESWALAVVDAAALPSSTRFQIHVLSMRGPVPYRIMWVDVDRAGGAAFRYGGTSVFPLR